MWLRLRRAGTSRRGEVQRRKIRSASAVSLNFLTPLLRTHPRQSLLVRIAMGLAKLKIDEVDVAGKRVLIRVDFNVPQDKKDPSKITNTAR